jgi:amino acid transporter
MADTGDFERWAFPGWGTAQKIDDLGEGPVRFTDLGSGMAHKLGVWKSTAICGNDITSSCLYVSALCALQAGPYAPIALLLVAAVLYLYRSIYAEVGSALPLNGGAYNVLLNTTSKARACIAACLTLLSYIATAVISGYEAMHYLHALVPHLPVILATVALLGFFALLNLVGIAESGSVALGLFIFHIVTLTLLVIFAGVAVFHDSTILAANWATPVEGGMTRALWFGFAAAMLGISGFESSANFIEEQKQGVFPKTLRNMWIAVAIFNPLISFLSLGVVPLSAMEEHKEDLLAQMGLVAGGQWLQQLVAVDAVLVLSGAVLTGYVGVTGLVRRLSLDRCLPQFLLSENKLRRTNHWIIALFFALCCSILFISAGDVGLLAGVYTISFLGVMLLFALGNALLKIKRARLPRAEHASWGAVLVAALAVIIGLAGNLMLKPQYVSVFALYFVVTLAIFAVMLWRLQIYFMVLAAVKGIVDQVLQWNRGMQVRLLRGIRRIQGFHVIYFTKGDNLASLNRVARYVIENEQSSRLKVVHIYEKEEDIPVALSGHLNTIDRLYPRLRIDLVLIRGKFSPELIERVSQRLKVPKNYMFIGTPGDQFPHNISELGGVRLVM